MIITRATPTDLPLLLQYRQEAAAWLRNLGIDQWSNAFPDAHILASIEAGNVFLLKDGPQTAATITLDSEPEPGLWTEAELREPSMHLHKLIVNRAYAGQGIGSRLVDWACDRAAQAGDHWVRINVWSTNERLQAYWGSQGFQHVRTVVGGGVGGAGVAGWLGQRAADRNDRHEFVETP
ncbi:GNAT family N-acetyltransferase [Kitasatospora sp. MBT63]|uniref:GNAT family N-acetyltransferase n=1 Tax=Kitasatospora sp. MBT63 TaxID=1444768 RepID=UPI00053A151E|nr:GNAT family N-acetyltransferase [Kitasatospora sp. MBT63]